jgi:hypothetical protein
MMTKNKSGRLILMLFLAGVLPALACQTAGLPSGTKATPANQSSVQIIQTENPQQTATPGNQLSIPILGVTQQGNVQILGDAAGEPAAIQPVNVKAQPVRVVQEIRDFMAGENGQNYYGKLLVIENPNPAVAIQETQCRLTSYDSSGAVIQTDDFEIVLLFPGERRTIYVGSSTQDSTPVAKLEFAITQQGQPVKTSLTSQSLSSERVKYWPESGIVTGIVRNSSNYLIDKPILTTVLYDEQGQVIGVGKDSATGFVPPNGQVGASLSAPKDLHPARVEFFVVPSSIWSIKSVMDNHLALQVTDWGSIEVVEKTDTVGAMAFFIVTNPNIDFSIGDLIYQVTAYDAQGFVLGVTPAYNSLPVIFPGEKVAVWVNEFSVLRGSSIASVEVQVNPLLEKRNLLDYRALGIDKSPLSATIDDQSQAQNNPSQVICVLNNAWKNPIESARVMAVAYDSGGKIVGIGSQDVSVVPANGQTKLTISMLLETGYNGTPARIELFAYASSPTNIR